MTPLFILLGLQNPGQIKIFSGGILWKRQGGGKSIEVDKADIVSVTWMKVPRSNQLGVQIKDGLFYKFTGFRDQVIFCPPEFPFTYI
jgi:structure-specific recognition protein 1